MRRSKITWISFLPAKNKNFERGIMLLPEKWQKVLDQNEHYIIQ